MRLGMGVGSESVKKIYKGVRIYESGEEAYMFPEVSTLVFGSPALLRSTIDRLNENGSQNDKLNEILVQTNGASLLWVVVKPDVLLASDGLREMNIFDVGTYQKLKSIQYASFVIEPSEDGLRFSALAYCKESQEARELYTYLDNNRRNLLYRDGSNVFLCSFLIISDVTTEGSFVHWETPITTSALTKLLATKVIIPDR
jgi:hypothetical protein